MTLIGRVKRHIKILLKIYKRKSKTLYTNSVQLKNLTQLETHAFPVIAHNILIMI